MHRAIIQTAMSIVIITVFTTQYYCRTTDTNPERLWFTCMEWHI